MTSPIFRDTGTITLSPLDDTLSEDSLYINNMTSPGPVSFDLSDTITLSNTVGVTGAIGSGYTYSNIPNITISNGAYTTTSAFGNVWGGSNLNVDRSGQLDLTGENADIKINGKSLMKVIESLEQRLNILTPNKELEAEWDELRELGERYRELEKQCEEKAKMWAKLKSMPPPEIV